MKKANYILYQIMMKKENKKVQIRKNLKMMENRFYLRKEVDPERRSLKMKNRNLKTLNYNLS